MLTSILLTRFLDIQAKQEQAPTIMTPQVSLDIMLRTRGHSTRRYQTLKSAYYNTPNEEQRTGYTNAVLEAIRHADLPAFRKLLADGMSPNACNAYGESIVHMVCRRGLVDFLRVLILAGCRLQSADDYGRTPLHDACWAAEPNFAVVELILKCDVRLFHMTDARGAVPLEYVHVHHYQAWLEFLKEKADVYWPRRSIAEDGEQGPPGLVSQEPNTRPIPLRTRPVATILAIGEVDKPMDDTEVESDTEYDSESDYTDSDEDSELSVDEDEMAGILQTLSVSVHN